MRPEYGMYLQQTVKMRMTPRLQQAIRILQLSTPELLECVKQEIEDNPVLEYTGIDREPYAARPNSPGQSVYDPLQRAAWNDRSLERHLQEQLNIFGNVPRPIRPILSYMIGNLDANGYLEPSLSDIVEALQTNLEQVERALQILQDCDPAGVGARNLTECLLLQSKHVPECPPLVPILIRGHLEDIAAHRMSKLATITQASPQDIREAIEVIKGLNPRPGAAYHTGAIQYIVPDVFIEKVGEQFAVRVNDVSAPRLTINGTYERMLKEGAGKYEAGKFLHAKFQEALFFMKCIKQRRLTLLRVTEAIVKEQIACFHEGISELKPMTLKQIAEQVNLHESTVSRATAGKYAQTPWGVFELSFFFPSGLKTDLGDAASSEHVKARIKEWLSREDGRKPYTDQQLANFLAKEGIRIARRTVSKYREELGMLSSVQRKRP